MTIISRRAAAANGAFDAVKDFYFNSRYGERRVDPGIADFTFGNPHEMPLDGIVAAIREAAVPQDKNWFAYKTSEEEPQAFLAERGRQRARPSLRAAGHRAHRRRLRGDLGRLPAGARRRRRGDLLRAGLVLLRADAARRRRRPAEGAAEAAALRPRPRRDRGGDRAADAAGDRQHAAQSDRPHLRARGRWPRSPTCSSAPRAGSAAASSCSPTSPIGACASTGAASSARRRSIPGR